MTSHSWIPIVVFALTAGPTPRPADWPVAWSSYRMVESREKDFADLKAHGVGLVSIRARDSSEAKELLNLARRFGMKYEISLPDVTESAELVRQSGLQPVDALMIGGVYQGQAIDRHLFRFTAARHEIVIEPPAYNRKFAYTLGSRSTGPAAAGEWIAHYYPDMPPPVRAEVVVPLKRFDGRQHLKIVPASIGLAPAGAKPENDTVTADMPPSSETRNRKLYRISFDLTGLGHALLDQVGLAVYWPYQGSKQYWMFGRGAVSAAAPSTQQALRNSVQRTLKLWTEAAGGKFPHDVVLAIRFGDECFYVTGHTYQSNSQAVSYPLWDYSALGIQAYHQRAGRLEYPRTWGFPEIYGPDSYAWWLYSLHERCAALAGVVREEIAKSAPGLLVLRNTTRMGALDVANDHDGSGPELLTKNLDIVHLDPYPVTAAGYGTAIPRDMSYYSGLARRYQRLLVPWMQAHTYGSLQHVSPEQVDRMAEEQWRQGVDAIMWLGYGDTFPKVRPDSWERAAVFHKRLAASLPPKPVAKMAVLRAYTAWSLTSRSGDQIRNPADWMLQQLLEVWAVQRGQPYDVFELPPRLSKAEQDALARDLKKYSYVVSTTPRPGAWVIGAGTNGQLVAPSTAKDVQRQFEQELVSRGWLKSAK